MRIMKCVSGPTVTVLGNVGSVVVGPGWQGDVDVVIGRTDRGPETLAQALGHHLTDENFHDVGKGKPAKNSAAASPQNEE